jgi:soluble P-type ATPase
MVCPVVALEIPGYGVLELEHLVLDVNGTLACDGRLCDGVAARVAALTRELHVVAITAATHGPVEGLASELGVEIEVIKPGDEAGQKHSFVQRLGPFHVVAIGNGANDALMLEEAAVGIAVLGPECAAASAVHSADVIAADITAALDLLLKPERLLATLRH